MNKQIYLPQNFKNIFNYWKLAVFNFLNVLYIYFLKITFNYFSMLRFLYNLEYFCIALEMLFTVLN